MDHATGFIAIILLALAAFTLDPVIFVVATVFLLAYAIEDSK